jgi:hypothetical protein
LPGSAFEVVKTEFFFHLLVSLLAYPARLMVAARCASQSSRVGWRGSIFLSRDPVFADEPSLVTGQILLTLVPDPLRGAIDDPVLQGHLPARHLRQQEDGGGDDLRRQ